jgi:hypothetical protein
MAASSKLYGPALLSLAAGQINWVGGAAKALLLTSAYTPNQDTHRYKSDLTNELPTANGYTLRGVTLTTKTSTYDAPTNVMMLDCDDPSWAAATLTARYLVFYIDTGTDATSPLVAYVDFGADVSSTNAPFTYQVPVTGAASLTAA